MYRLPLLYLAGLRTSWVLPQSEFKLSFFGIFFGEVIPLRPYTIYPTESSAKSMATSGPIIEEPVEEVETLQRPAIAVHVRSSTPSSRSDSGTIISTSGQNVAYHSRTAEERDATPPHALVLSRAILRSHHLLTPLVSNV